MAQAQQRMVICLRESSGSWACGGDALSLSQLSGLEKHAFSLFRVGYYPSRWLESPALPHALLVIPAFCGRCSFLACRLRAGLKPGQQCLRDDDPDSPQEMRTTQRGCRMGLAWQLLTCWSGTVDVLVSAISRLASWLLLSGLLRTLMSMVVFWGPW